MIVKFFTIKRGIERYNQGNIFEKQALRKEPLPSKLMEKGIIVYDED